MAISREDIEHIADLSMLNLQEDEILEYTKSMQEIVEFATQVNEVDTEGVDISAFALDRVNVFRKDEIRESFDRELLLQNAPDSQDGMFKIPKVID